MKLSTVLLGTVAADWSQPRYWDAINAVQQRSGASWGFPVGQRTAAAWSLCPAVEVPEGADSIDAVF